MYANIYIYFKKNFASDTVALFVLIYDKRYGENGNEICREEYQARDSGLNIGALANENMRGKANNSDGDEPYQGRVFIFESEEFLVLHAENLLYL